MSKLKCCVCKKEIIKGDNYIHNTKRRKGAKPVCKNCIKEWR